MCSEALDRSPLEQPDRYMIHPPPTENLELEQYNAARRVELKPRCRGATARRHLVVSPQ
jgi:hypothetical protein